MDKLMASGRVSYCQFSNWIKKNPTSTTHALCKLCNNKYMDVSRMGTSALVSHANGTRHKQKVSAVNPRHCFSRQMSKLHLKLHLLFPPVQHQLAMKQFQKQTTMHLHLLKPKSTLLMMQVMCLKLIESHSSYRSCLVLSRLFRKMFPDSEIASKFKLSKKIQLHYFFSMLVKVINASPFYNLTYDESLNTLLQKEQMDVQIRYWSVEKVCSETRYLI